MTQYVRVSGAWKTVDKAYVRVSGAWKEVAQTFVRVNGVWQSLSVPVPNLAGLTTTQADAAIAAAQLTKGTVTSGYTSTAAYDNKVGAQTIAAGTLVVPGTAVGYTYTTYRATPATPTLSYYSTTGKFQITNYNSAYIYTISAGTRSGSIVTLPSGTSSATIKAQSFSGGSYSGTRTYANHVAEYTPDTRYEYDCGTYECNCGWKSCGCECGGGGCGCYGNAGQSWGQCGCPGTMCWYNYGCDTCTRRCTGGSAPQLITVTGYTWTGSEWYKIT